MIEYLGWIVASFLFGTLAGIFAHWHYLSKKPAEPTLRPYSNPILTHRPGEPIDEKLLNNGTAEMLKLEEAELQAMTQEIMREAGVDEGTARKEVALILAEANALGQ